MERLGNDVGRELARLGPGGRIGELTEVWPAAVGEAVARNAWPARVARDGTLHVATSSSPWAFELAQLEADVLRRLRAAVGAKSPKRIRFAVGRLPELGPDPADRAARAVAEPRAEDVEKAVELTAEIEDDELREAVAKAAAQSLFRAETDRSF
jgi:hypothetical protein